MRAHRFIAPLCAFQVAVGAGCEGKSSKRSAASDPAPAAESALSATEPAAPASVPPAIEPAVFGTLTPLPALEGAHRVAVVGEGADAVIVAGGLGFVRFIESGSVRAEIEVTGGVQLIEVLDTDGDGREEVVVAAGRFRGAADAAASVVVIDPDDPAQRESIELPVSTRGQVVAIDAASGQPGDLYVAHFVDKFQVAVHRYRRKDGGWSGEEIVRDRMLFHLAAVVDGDAPWPIAGARLYGEDADSPGGVTLYDRGGRVDVPSLRGARAVVAGASGEIFFSDGWHKNYGQKALGLVSRASRGVDGWRREVLVNIKGRPGFDRLRRADLDGDGRAEIVASGLGPALSIAEGRARALSTAAASDAYPANLDGDPQLEVAIVGDAPGVWNLP